MEVVTEIHEISRLQAENSRTTPFVTGLSITAVILGTIIALIAITSILKQLGADPAMLKSIMEDEAKENSPNPQGLYASVIRMLNDLLGQVAAASEELASQANQLTAMIGQFLLESRTSPKSSARPAVTGSYSLR